MYRIEWQGETALIKASRNGHYETVKLLLAHSAIVDLMNRDGESALSLVRDGNHQEVRRSSFGSRAPATEAVGCRDNQVRKSYDGVTWDTILIINYF